MLVYARGSKSSLTIYLDNLFYKKHLQGLFFIYNVPKRCDFDHYTIYLMIAI